MSIIVLSIFSQLMEKSLDMGIISVALRLDNEIAVSLENELKFIFSFKFR
jgi:hypothetical protein